MELPLQITFHRLTQSNVIAAKVRQRAQKLEQRFEGILSCRVAIEALEAEPLKRKQLRVRLEIGVPGSQLVVTRDPDEHRFDPDGLLTINEAFCAMRQKLEAYRSFLNGGPTMQPSLDAEANDTGSACESARRLPYFSSPGPSIDHESAGSGTGARAKRIPGPSHVWPLTPFGGRAKLLGPAAPGARASGQATPSPDNLLRTFISEQTREAHCEVLPRLCCPSRGVCCRHFSQ